MVAPVARQVQIGRVSSVEGGAFSIEGLAASPKRTTCWDGVRNYQARNFMREMAVGQDADFSQEQYHVQTILTGNNNQVGGWAVARGSRIDSASV